MLAKHQFESICHRLSRDEASLTMLNLNHQGLSPQDICHLAEALQYNTKLVVLFLDGNDITSRGAMALAKSLSHHPALAHLFLSYNCIGAPGAQALAQALLDPRNRIQVLKLTHNSIGRRGAQALGDALRMNDHLRTLVIDENDIDRIGMTAIAAGLGENGRLETLDLRCNRVAHGRMVATFLDIVRTRNKTLSTLLLDDDFEHVVEDDDNSDFAQLQFYLDLNRCGRVDFGSPSIPADAWARVLGSAAKKDEKLLFHVLRSRPDLI